MDTQREELIREHLEAIRLLQAQAASEERGPGSEGAGWPPPGYYALFHVLAGLVLGLVGATVSLLANVVGALAAGHPPLKLIQVYLTFPMGEKALHQETLSNPGLVLFVGCVLYLITGGLYGVVFQVFLTTLLRGAHAVARFLAATVIGLGLWLVNFYGVLNWLQPTLQGGNWIVEEIPHWVAALTHLAFAWSMFLMSQWGGFEPPAPAGSSAPVE
jgi:hypothetical protein